MSDITLKNASTDAVVVSEGVSSKVGTRGAPRGPRRPKPLNVKALQRAVNRAEVNGPLASLSALYEAIAADEDYNHAGDGVGPIAKRIKAGLELGLTIQTVAAPKGRPANSDNPANGITEECADELLAAYAHIANRESLEFMIGKALGGSKRYMRFFATLDRFINGGEEEATAVPAENAGVGEPVPA